MVFASTEVQMSTCLDFEAAPTCAKTDPKSGLLRNPHFGCVLEQVGAASMPKNVKCWTLFDAKTIE